MVRIVSLRRATLALVLAGGLALAAPAVATSPPPPDSAEETADAESQLPLAAELDALVCTVLSPLCALFGDGEEGSSMDPFGNR